MTNSKKVYIKAYTRINVGDDLFIHILCARYPKHVFYMMDRGMYTEVFKNISNLIITNDIDKINFDAIVYIGGSIFIENSKESLIRVLELKNEIIRDDIPTYIIGANFGPYITNEYLDVVKKEVISNVKGITFRDRYSYNLFKDMPNVHFAPDVVFSLDIDKYNKDKKKEVGISLIHHLERNTIKQNYSNYLDKIVEIIEYYISEGYDIRLLSFCEYERDEIAINDLLDKISQSDMTRVRISRYGGNMDEMLNTISSLSLIVATRFHSMILGFRFGIPVIPICYSDKMKNVLEDMGFNKDDIYDFETLDAINYKHVDDNYNSINFREGAKQFLQLDEILGD